MPKGYNKLDLANKTFGWLFVIECAGINKFRKSKWLCRCKCGILTIVTGSLLVKGETTSCGCRRLETSSIVGKLSKTHGETGRTPEYVAWKSMKQRCYYTKNVSYGDYGGRGIRVCKRWLKSYENFLQDMGRKPSETYSIDRINNNGNYTPSNCRWATKSQQSSNQRKRYGT
jgi:hypothetical protein